MIRNGYGHMVLEAYVAKLREMRRQRQATLGAIIVEGRKAVALKPGRSSARSGSSIR